MIDERMQGPILEARGIKKVYPSPAGGLEVLSGVDLELPRGDITAVVGASGTGKSTLLHILGGLDRPTSGHVELAGREIGRMGDEALSELRNRRVGFVFQFHHLLPEFSAAENVALPAMMAGVSKEEALRRSLDLLVRLGLEGRSEHRPAKLSGGEQQRVAVARALVNRPDVVLADEPSGNLDQASSDHLHEVLWELNETEDQTLLLVTHDIDLAKRARRVFELSRGRLRPWEG
ncbi:MAG: ABC transporter ATP-binding protein [bacterium]